MSYLSAKEIENIASDAVLRQGNRWDPGDRRWRDEGEFQMAYLNWRIEQRAAVEAAIREALRRGSFWGRLFG